MPVDIPKIIQEFSGQFKSEKMILRIYQQWSVRNIFLTTPCVTSKVTIAKKRKQQYNSDIYYAIKI
jgi:hypothetical protein